MGDTRNGGELEAGGPGEALAPVGRDLSAMVARALQSDVVLEVEVRVAEAVAAAEALRSVSDGDGYEAAVQAVRDLANATEDVEEVLGVRFREPLHKAWKLSTERIRELLGPVIAETGRLKRAAAAWQDEQDRKRREEEARIRQAQEEAERRQREAEAAEVRRRAEAEAAERRKAAEEAAARARDEQERNRIAREAAEEEARIKAEGEREAAAVWDAPSEVGNVEVLSTVPVVAGVSGRDNWRAEVEDLAALIRAAALDLELPAPQRRGLAHLLEADEKALNGMARSMKGAMNIPGVRAVNNRGLAVGKGRAR